MCVIGARTEGGKGEVTLKLKLFDTCLMSGLMYGMEVWKNLSKAEIQQPKKFKVKPKKNV